MREVGVLRKMKNNGIRAKKGIIFWW